MHEPLPGGLAFLESMQYIKEALLVLLVALISGFVVDVIEEHYGEVTAGASLAGLEK